MTQSIGPPSLAQGTRIAVGFSTSISRFIPACGELSKPSWAIVQLDGSSPLARGTQDLDRLGYVADRFTPAYAGNSFLEPFQRSVVSVHPRLRGELAQSLEQLPPLIGSSPLTRGTLTGNSAKNQKVRFIPAYAGNSLCHVTPSDFSAVHPRLRGELFYGGAMSFGRNGSSPLTRGTLFRARLIVRSWRFIPAYAGNSCGMFLR